MGWKLHIFDHFFHAKTQGECLNRSVYFCTDLSAKMGVSIDVYCESNLILIFGTRFLKSAISMQFWIFATTLTRRPPDWWCDRQHQYGGQKIQVAAVAFRVHFMPSHRSPMPLSNFFSKRRRVVLDAGPLLEPPVPPLVRLPVVRDAGPLLEPLAPPLVRLRAGGPAMSYRRCASNSVIFAL